MTYKIPANTTVIPNPLHEFASYTYAWSLWWINPQDYNDLMSSTDVTGAMSWDPGPGSYVIAEDSGLYPDRRMPFIPAMLNYQIQDVSFSTVLENTTSTQSSSFKTGKLTILEPYGVTFLENLAVASSQLSGPLNNWTLQPYLLQLDFHGYDDNGVQIPTGQSNLYRKRFPITITKVAVGVSTRGSEYKIDFAPISSETYTAKGYGTLPCAVPAENVTTVADFFKQVEKTVNGFWLEQKRAGSTQMVDNIKFDIDPDIANSKVVYDKEATLSSASFGNLKVDSFSLSATEFKVPAGTRINDIITKLLAHSEYVQKQMDPKTQTVPFNTFKTQVKVVYANNGAPTTSLDAIKNDRPKTITYCIHQRTNWKGSHPAIAVIPDSTPYTIKRYDYLYSGKNVDIIDFKVTLDNSFYTKVLASPFQVSKTESSQSTSFDFIMDSLPRLQQTPSVLTALNPGVFGSVPILTPMKIQPVVNDQRKTLGFNIINSPNAQRAIDAIYSSYDSLTDPNMLKLDLTIVGDPTLVKQDDWYYIPSPSLGSVYNNWTGTSQQQFAKEYGHIQMGVMNSVVEVNVYTPIDIDVDYANTGEVFPPASATKSLFSGQYYIVSIDNKFSNGKFEQVLHLAKFINDAHAKKATEVLGTNSSTTSSREDPVKSSNTALQGSAGTNTADATSLSTIQKAPESSVASSTSSLTNNGYGSIAGVAVGTDLTQTAVQSTNRILQQSYINGGRPSITGR